MGDDIKNIATIAHPSPLVAIEVPAQDAEGHEIVVTIPAEWPLTLYLDKQEVVTLMTMGQHAEDLALGYLRNQRILMSIDEVREIHADWDVGAVAVSCKTPKDLSGALSRRTVTSGCGQGTSFGHLIEDIENIKLSEKVTLSRKVLMSFLENIRALDSVYKKAGAVHGCILADNDGKIMIFVEDVGRHNAVDAISGRMWREGIAGEDKLFYTTGRLTSEMVIKCVQMGIPILISRSGLTQMGYDLALRHKMLLIGRCHGNHYQVYVGGDRIKS